MRRSFAFEAHPTSKSALDQLMSPLHLKLWGVLRLRYLRLSWQVSLCQDFVDAVDHKVVPCYRHTVKIGTGMSNSFVQNQTTTSLQFKKLI